MNTALESDFEPHHNGEAIQPPLLPRYSSERVPLSFWQESMWEESHRFGVTHRLRTYVTAVRVSGSLDICRLRQSLSEVVRRHEALRTRIVEFDGVLAQEIDEAREYELTIVDLSGLPSAVIENEAKRTVDEFVNEKGDLALGPLFVSRLVRLNDRDHIFVLAMDAMISDGLSARILFRSLWTIYFQFVRGLSLSLPQMPVQFADYAIWQRKAYRWWINKHGKYWEERLSLSPHVRFPIDAGIGASAHAKPAIRSVQFARNLCNGLRELSKREHTTLAMTMLAAYAGTVLRWQKKREIIIRFAVHGRNRVELLNMIGCIASMLYLRIELEEGDTFMDLLRRVTREVYIAHTHHSLGYIPLQSEEAEYTKSTCVNWLLPPLNVTRELRMLNVNGNPSADEIRLAPFPFTQTAIDREWIDAAGSVVDFDPYVFLRETGDAVSCSFWYMSNRLKSTTIERLLQSFHELIEELLRHPQTRVIMK